MGERGYGNRGKSGEGGRFVTLLNNETTAAAAEAGGGEEGELCAALFAAFIPAVARPRLSLGRRRVNQSIRSSWWCMCTYVRQVQRSSIFAIASSTPLPPCTGEPRLVLRSERGASSSSSSSARGRSEKRATKERKKEEEKEKERNSGNRVEQNSPTERGEGAKQQSEVNKFGRRRSTRRTTTATTGAWRQ